MDRGLRWGGPDERPRTIDGSAQCSSSCGPTHVDRFGRVDPHSAGFSGYDGAERVCISGSGDYTYSSYFRIPARPVQAEGHTARALRDFLRLDTPSFYGEPNPDIAERWLDQVARNLDIPSIVDEHTRVPLQLTS